MYRRTSRHPVSKKEGDNNPRHGTRSQPYLSQKLVCIADSVVQVGHLIECEAPAYTNKGSSHHISH